MEADTKTAAVTLSDKDYLRREMARRELARKSYRRYLYYVHAPTWVRTKMSDFLADTVQRFVETETGNAYDILLIETPPQHGKSLTVTESFPSWYLGKYPTHRIIEASYNDDTARKFGRKNMEKVEQYGGGVFGLKQGSIWTTTDFELSNGWGRMISRGIMSGITGNPANLLIIDDPVKNRAEADSETYRNRLWEEWQNTLKSRLAAQAKVIIIMTPWHEDDLAARVLKNEPHVTLVRLPIEAEEKDLLGRPVGDALCPELGKDNHWLEQFKASYLSDPSNGGLRAWQALYQCSPRVEGGNLVRREWWKWYDKKDITAFGTTVISVDATFKDEDTNDYVAIQVWGKLGNDYYLRYALKRHLNFPNTVQAIRLVKKLYPDARYILIEDKANGSAIIQTLRHEFVGVISITPKGGKVSRVNAVSPAIESGNVWLPKDELFSEDLVDEFAQFPNGEHDDACFVAGTPVATAFGDKPIEQVKAGDYVWTPFGLRRVTWAGQTGVKEVVTRIGLTGTPWHRVFTTDGAFHPLESLLSTVNCDMLSLKGVITWKYRKLLSSMESPIDSWEPENITLVNRHRMKDDDMRKDFMWRFGSIIRDRRFLQATRFIIKTATLLITTSATWSVYRLLNTVSCGGRARRPGSIWTRFVTWLQRGTKAKRAGDGTPSTPEKCFDARRFASVSSAAGPLCPGRQPAHDSAATTAPSNGSTRTRRHFNTVSVWSAAKSLMQKFRQESNPRRPVLAPVAASCGPRTQVSVATTARYYTRSAPFAARSLTPFAGTQCQTEASVAVKVTPSSGESRRKKNKAPVYNLTVEGCHLYYAGGILVHNCDSCSQALSWMLFSSGSTGIPMTAEQKLLDQAIRSERNMFTSPALYDVYGARDIY